MKRDAVVVIVVIAVFGACGGNVSPAPDAAPVATGAADIPVGDSCDAQASYFCAQYTGLCIESRCQLQCAEAYPRCPKATRETHPAGPLGSPCICAPL